METIVTSANENKRAGHENIRSFQNIKKQHCPHPIQQMQAGIARASLFRRLQGFIPANKAAVGQLKPLRNIVFKYRNGILPGSLCGGLLVGDGYAACLALLLEEGIRALIRQGVPGIIDGGIGIIGR